MSAWHQAMTRALVDERLREAEEARNARRLAR
jgi:hypothetical protein